LAFSAVYFACTSSLRRRPGASVAVVPVADKEPTWDLFVVWQRGKIFSPLRALLEALQLKPAAKSVNRDALNPLFEKLCAFHNNAKQSPLSDKVGITHNKNIVD